MKIFEIEEDAIIINWFVGDPDEAFDSALNVVGWLSVRHAGNGSVALASGTNGKEGSSYIHNHEGNSSFELYVLQEVSLPKLELIFKVYTDRGLLRTDLKEKTAILSVNAERRPSGQFLAQFRENGFHKLTPKSVARLTVDVKDYYVRNNAAGMALAGYFQCSVETSGELPMATVVLE